MMWTQILVVTRSGFRLSARIEQSLSDSSTDVIGDGEYKYEEGYVTAFKRVSTIAAWATPTPLRIQKKRTPERRPYVDASQFNCPRSFMSR